ncbi:MAG: sulfite exporter TauE/SafE family protein [Rhodobacteraceae bacterium]|nr:sulfite exporter TauE/SafE family protein [Paracoccaceae bacterium]
MDLFTWWILLIAAPAVVLAGISKGGFGSGAAFVSSSILALVIEPRLALGVMLPLLMLIDVRSIPAYWQKWSPPDARILILGSLPGVVLGLLFFRWADPNAIRLLIGAICVLFVVWQALPIADRPTSTKVGGGGITGLFMGAVLGFTSFVSHAGGPAAAIYLLRQGLDKTSYQATTVIVFWAVNLAKFFVYAAMGIFTVQSLMFGLVMAPFALLGTWIGIRAHHLVPDRLFFAVTYAMLLLTGAKLIWDGLA